MKVLVIGSNGMAGHVVTAYLKEKGYDVTTMAREDADICLDIENTDKLNKFFKWLLNATRRDFDFVINCVGVLIGEANANPTRASYVNAFFPHYLEEAYSGTNTRIVHLSTDCVFDGKKGDRYLEDDIHTEMNFYGRSKSLGEINNEKDITFRMSIIGPEKKKDGTGLMNWFMTTDQEVTGWDNAFWNGLTTLELAKCIDNYMQKPDISGIHHLTIDSNEISKYDLLVKISEHFKLNKPVKKGNGPKPVNKILKNSRQQFKINNYDTQLKELFEFYRKHF